MYNTNNPIPSSALEDMADNAQTFDALVTKTEGTTTDRNGITRRVFQQILMDMGFQPLSGSFQTGATITARNQTLYDEVSQVFYSWNGALPKVVPTGSTPATAGGIGALLWVDRTDLMLRGELESGGLSIDDIANFKESSGSGNLGIDLFTAYSAGTVGAHLVPVPGGANNGSIDCTSAFNAKILSMAQAGGGVLKPIAGTYLINGSVLIPSNVYLDLRGVKLIGNGSNIILKSAAVLSGVLTDITTEHGTSSLGAGTHFVLNSGVIGGTLASAAMGIRGHRLNYGTNIVGTFFDTSLTQSYYTTHSWGLKVQSCTMQATAVMGDFVDWTEVSGNSFEGWSSSVTARALIIQASYGGSYSASIHSNGFHHWSHGIEVNCEATNMEIFSNHFEDTKYHISGNSLTKQRFNIHNNWMKANLIPSNSGVIGIAFTNIIDSNLGPNHFSTDGSSSFDAHVIITNSSCWGNKVPIPYSPSNSATADLLKYQVNSANEIIFRGGSNASASAQPFVEPLAGSSGFTIEKYRSRYNMVENSIPFCTVVYSGTTVTLTTQIPSGTYGSHKLCKYNFRIVGSNTYVMAGFFCMLDVYSICNREAHSNDAGTAVITTSVVGGFVTLTITGVPSGGNITGWIKEE